MLFNGIFKRLGVMSFRGRLWFWVIWVALLLAIAAAIPLSIFGKGLLQENAVRNLDREMNVQQVIVDSWLADKLSHIEMISELPTIRNTEFNEVEEVLAAFNGNQNHFSEIVYVNEDGLLEVGWTDIIGLDVSDQIYFEKAIEGSSFITDVLIGKQSEQPVIFVSAPVYDYEQNFKGMVVDVIPLKTINFTFSKYQDENREMYIVNRDGVIITETRQGSIGEYIHSELFHNASNGKRIDHFYEENNGEMVVGDYRLVHNNQWFIIGEIKRDVIFQLFTKIATLLAICLFLLIIAVFAISIKVSKRLERPIYTVLEGTRKIGKGDWKYRIKEPQYEEALEFKELRENFNRMAELIDQQISSALKNDKRFHLITEHSSDMITIHDSTGKYLYMSPAGKDILQYDYKEIIGKEAEQLIHPDDRDKLKIKHVEVNTAEVAVHTYRIRRKDGEYIWFESSVTYLQECSKEMQIVVVSRNITERKLVEQKLKEANKLLTELSSRDGLTGVWNRRVFDQQLIYEWEQAAESQYPLSLFMIDLDYFKEYNDTYGHQMGDECLQEVTKKVRDTVKQFGDIVYRYGGEEFSVILPEADCEQAKVVAENIRKNVELLAIAHRGSKINDNVTVSIGIATLIPTKDVSIGEFIELADRALYKAKEKGRNCIRV